MIPLLILIFVLHLSVSAILLPPPFAFYGPYFSYQTLPHLVSSLNKIVPLLVRYSTCIFVKLFRLLVAYMVVPERFT